MELDHDICYRAICARDARFDGRFFTGVTSTGIYCRPVCPARTPGAMNCTFFICAAAAEEAGFRPCRRCRPETAPGTPAWRGTSTTVSRALRLIEEGALTDASIEDMSARLGVGGRHLRRLFNEHLGASPAAVANTRRIHFAKRMIEETSLSMTHIALAAGFNNVRRFNAAVRQSFDRTPTEIRKLAPSGLQHANGGTITLRLSCREPFDWHGLLAWLAPRAIPGIEQVKGMTYRRTVSLNDFTGVIELEPATRRGPALLLRTPVEASPVLLQIVDGVRALFDLDADPAAIAEQLSEDPLLAPAARKHPGIRVPGCWDRFELAVRAILGQQVTVVGATRLTGRLAERFGRPCTSPKSLAGHPDRLFPRPEDLIHADIAGLGMPSARAETIRRFARAVYDGEPILETAPDLPTAIARLTSLPGIGDWTAQYIAMRALREPDAFPAGDLGLRKALVGNDDKLPTGTTLRKRSEIWRPWRAYAAMLLWRNLADNTEKGRR
ncbi:MAG: DNA-3-methyladenine glycosylase 2 family protein [bacterium]|nr:DNA-3-methyladenine glycosylase 2 family protein [bacterium]